MEFEDESTIQEPEQRVAVLEASDAPPSQQMQGDDSDDEYYENPVDLIREFGNNPLMERYVGLLLIYTRIG